MICDIKGREDPGDPRCGIDLGQQTHWVSFPPNNSNSPLAPGMGLGLDDSGLGIGQVLGEAAAPSGQRTATAGPRAGSAISPCRGRPRAAGQAD